VATQDYAPTIYDVARKAGVSANTVSRALNGRSGVASDTRARIVAIAESMDYHPHLGARSLRVRREGCVGVTVPAPIDRVPLSRNFFMYLCDELYRIFAHKGERVCLDLNPYGGSADADYARSVWQKLYSACIVAGPLAVEDQTIHRLHRSGVPYLVLGRLDSLPECSCATVDYEQAAFECVMHLVARGHRRIGMLKGLPGYQPGVERMRGYLRALELSGIEPEERLVQPVSFGAQNVSNSTYRLLNDHKLTALVDASGLEDAAAIREGARLARRVAGGDFEVLCWTYSTEYAIMEEACAHLWLPVREAASEGLELLAEWYWEKREGPVHIVYPPTIMETTLFKSRDLQSPPKPNRLFDASLGESG
jgi:LacI family transcriptional regulator